MLDLIILAFRNSSSFSVNYENLSENFVEDFVCNEKFHWLVSKRITRSRKVSAFIHLGILRWR